jgi:hypothetical protein
VIAYPTTAPLVLNHRLAEPIRGFCKQGVRGSSPLGSTAGQRPFSLDGRSLCRVCTPAKYCSTPSGNLTTVQQLVQVSSKFR